MSRYRVLRTIGKGRFSLIEWTVETGRPHQVRVHARSVFCPILGDGVYGDHIVDSLVNAFNRMFKVLVKGETFYERLVRVASKYGPHKLKALKR